MGNEQKWWGFLDDLGLFFLGEKRKGPESDIKWEKNDGFRGIFMLFVLAIFVDVLG